MGTIEHWPCPTIQLCSALEDAQAMNERLTAELEQARADIVKLKKEKERLERHTVYWQRVMLPSWETDEDTALASGESAT